MNDKQEKKDNSFYYEKEKFNQLINKFDLNNEIQLSNSHLSYNI
jgi:hypothetical protein